MKLSEKKTINGLKQYVLKCIGTIVIQYVKGA